jgi:hypothetical protein
MMAAIGPVKGKTSGGAMAFEKAIVWVKWIGSHAAYDRIDVAEVRHGE